MEHPLITKGNRKVRFDFSVLNVALHRLGLHIHHPDELDLRDHILDAVLPVEKVDDLIVGHIDWHIQPRFRLFALKQHILIQLALVLRCQHIRHRLIFRNVQHPVQAVGHIEHISVVHKVNHQQILFARTAACTTAKLLQIDCFGHGRACHKQHRGMRAVPAFVQKVAGAENIGGAGFIVLQDFFPNLHTIPPGNCFRLHTVVPQQHCNFGCMVYAGTEDYCLFAVDVL